MESVLWRGRRRFSLFYLVALSLICLFQFEEVFSSGVPSSYIEKQRYDGWYNNLAHPAWGSKESKLTRKTPASYADGVYTLAGQGRPSARELSQALLKGSDGMASARNRTAMLAFFGQVVASEILQASEAGCPIEQHKIPIPECDEMFDADCRGGRYIPFKRASYHRQTGQSPNNPRQQLNYVTSWIDGSFIYSASEVRLSQMRAYKGGRFLADPRDPTMPPRNTKRIPVDHHPTPHILQILPSDKMYVLGDFRSNQNPALLTFGILFFRWHNRVADEVQRQHPDWADEDVFQRARRFVIAHLQNIVLYEFLPAFLGGEVPPYTQYRPELYAGISHVFQSAAFRFGHTLVPPGLYLRDPGPDCPFVHSPTGNSALRLCTTWYDAHENMFNYTSEQLLRGLASQLSEREDHVLCSDVRNKLFGPLEFSRRDLGALNIMRGRDNGLPDYNTVRRCFHLEPVTTWEDINPQVATAEPEVFKQLKKLYKDDLSNIDLYVGGLLESQDGPGELFRAIILQQFTQLRDADRFWFENTDNRMFTDEEIEEIRRITLWDIIVNASSVDPDDVQRDVFFHVSGDVCPQPRQLNASAMDPCPYLQGYDYFRDSEIPYIYSCILLLAVPVLVGGAGYAAVKLQNSRRRKFKIKQDELKHGRLKDKVMVKEWLDHNFKRNVKLKIGPKELCTVNRKGEKLRIVSFTDLNSLYIETSRSDEKKPMILVRTPKDHDLVLEFDSESARKKFLDKVNYYFEASDKQLNVSSIDREQMLRNAETAQKRKDRLEHFFREAYAITFGIKKGGQSPAPDGDASREVVMRTSLSKKEFAGALGMKPDDVFVRLMFNIVDKDGDGRISFQEFLDTVVLFSQGSTDEKLKIVFSMCDNDRNGLIDKNELSDMLKSLVEIAKTQKVTDAEVDELIDGMFRSTGLRDNESLTYLDFKKLMDESNGEFIAIGLDCKGAKHNFLDTRTNVARMQSFAVQDSNALARKTWWQRHYAYASAYLEENRQCVFYLILFYVINIALFCERFIHYSFMAEHTDLRHIMGVGIAITRGAAASLSFCYSLLLLTMCRNLLTRLKESSVQQYIPIDSHIAFHKIVAMTALFFSLLHSAGHLVNFYHISTQSVENLNCLTKEMSFTAENRPTITYWLFNTLTGITGVMLWTIMMIIFIFAHPVIRNKAFSYFWMTHQLYVFLYVFSLMHGMARLTGPPRFWIFFVVPGVIYTFDKIVSLRTRYLEHDIIETELLPSDVVKIKFYRPPNFKYHSGQWVRIACTAFRQSEYHSFTLTSAPHQNFLSCHIKAIGPWTWKLRKFFDPHNYHHDEKNIPKLRLEGPYGGGNQDWYKFEVAVMVGGGIGVTPYASILNDLVFGTHTKRYSGVACKKVYFLWICPTHRQFEWFIDVLREVEKKDVTNVLEMHIFITQFFHKFDLRTTMLYICENHFQRLSKRSMFTGLKAINHFGRPDMTAFLKFVQKKHSGRNALIPVSKVGVFSCGPSPLTNSINTACENVNAARKVPYFIHHYENFG